MESFGRIIAIIVVVVLLILLPAGYLLKKQNDLADDYVRESTVQLIEDIKTKNRLSLEEYEAYLRQLDASGKLYDVEIMVVNEKESKNAF